MRSQYEHILNTLSILLTFILTKQEHILCDLSIYYYDFLSWVAYTLKTEHLLTIFILTKWIIYFKKLSLFFTLIFIHTSK